MLRHFRLAIAFLAFWMLAPEMPYKGKMPYTAEMPYESSAPYLSRSAYSQFRPVAYANVLAGQHFNVSASLAQDCLDQDETGVNVSASYSDPLAFCDWQISPAPLEGAQSTYLVASSGNANAEIRFQGKLPSPITSGGFIAEWDFMNTVAETIPTNYFITMNGAVLGFPIVQMFPANTNMLFACDGTSFDTAISAWTLNTHHRLRIEYYITDGPGRCDTLTPGCDNCGCLWVDDSQVAECDAPTSAMTIDGWSYPLAADSFDQIIDRTYICNTNPPTGTRCGDNAPNVVLP